MSENPLVALAAAMRRTLSIPIDAATKDKAGQTARLDLIDMIPDMQRALIGEQVTVRNMTWSVTLRTPPLQDHLLMDCLKPLNLVALQAINRFKVAQYVPLEGSISYKDLFALCAVNEYQVRRIIRHAMTNRIFHEPQKEQVAHTTPSRLLAQDVRLDSWVFFLTDCFWPATARSVDAFQKWPGSENPKEVGVPLQHDRETTWSAEIATADRGIQSFRHAMEIVNEGEGWEDSYLVDNYSWGEIGKGTVVDVSLLGI